MYTWKTFSSAKTELAARLKDSGRVFWVDAELGIYIIEALRTFNSIANFYRDRAFFNTQVGFAFYDLTQSTNPDADTASSNVATAAMLGYNITDRDVITSIEYSLLEPITTNWTNWTGSDQFTLDDITRAIERRRNQFLSIITSHITHSQVYCPVGDGRIRLSDSIIDILRVAFKDPDANYTPLYIDNEYNASTLIIDLTPSTPINYSTILQSPKGIQLLPPNSDTGYIDILSVNCPTNLDESIGVLLNIPDDFNWIIKFGALADLLNQEGQSYDPIRAKYCEKRYEEGLDIVKQIECINQIAINAIIIQPTTLNDLDYYNSAWQNSSGQPTEIAIIGRNLIALAPVPDSTEYSIQVDVLRNIPIPSIATDYLQIGREHYDLILDYAFHLAMFKCAGVEFEGSYDMLDRFMRGSMLNNDKLRAQASQYSIMKSLSNRQEIELPRLEET
jgi:hypothetical protein